jgi:hypothetical protein
MKRGSVRELVVIGVLGLAGMLGCTLAQQVQRSAAELDSGGDGNGGIQGEVESVAETQAGDSEDVAGPSLGVQLRIALAYPRVDVGSLARVGRYTEVLNRSVAGDISEWPTMIFVGESARIGNVVVTPQEVRIVAGSTVPRAYSPEGDRAVDAPTGSPPGIRGQDNRPVLVIPAGASLVMVRIETDPSVGSWLGPGSFNCPDVSTSDWAYGAENFRLSYPGLGETGADSGFFWFGEFQYPGYGCPADGWLYFIVAGLNIDRSQLWLEYVAGTERGDLAFWTLTERPAAGEPGGGR